MTDLSKWLGETLGLYCVLIAAGMMIRTRQSAGAIFDMLENPGVSLAVSVFTVLLGVGMVVGHDLWVGSPATIVVTMIGWAALAKGFSLLVIPGPVMAKVYRRFALEPFFRVYLAALIVFGAWLAYASFSG